MKDKLIKVNINQAIQAGKIKKSPVCEGCGRTHHHLHGHHEDYTKPLAIIWLCPSCHHKKHFPEHKFDPSNTIQKTMIGHHVFLRQTREKFGMNQTQFADKIGSTARAIRAWEQEQNPIPKWLMIMLNCLNKLDTGVW